MSEHVDDTEHLYCRVVLEDSLHALRAQEMSEEQAREASLDLRLRNRVGEGGTSRR